MRNLYGFIILFALLGGALAQTPAPEHRKPALPIEQRVADLLKRMTLEEKVGQLTTARRGNFGILDTTGRFSDARARQVFRDMFSVDSNLDMHRVVEPGTFDIMVGVSSAETQSVPLEVVAK